MLFKPEEAKFNSYGDYALAALGYALCAGGTGVLVDCGLCPGDHGVGIVGLDCVRARALVGTTRTLVDGREVCDDGVAACGSVCVDGVVDRGSRADDGVSSVGKDDVSSAAQDTGTEVRRSETGIGSGRVPNVLEKEQVSRVSLGPNTERNRLWRQQKKEKKKNVATWQGLVVVVLGYLVLIVMVHGVFFLRVLRMFESSSLRLVRFV